MNNYSKGLTTLFVSDLVLAKSVVVSKTTSSLITSYKLNCTGHTLRGHVAVITKLKFMYNYVHLVPFPLCDIVIVPDFLPDPDFSPRLRGSIWVWPGRLVTIT